MRSLMLTMAAIALLAPAAAAAEKLPHHHLAVFAGVGTEKKADHPTVDGYAAGLEYLYRFRKHWAIGGAAELLGQDTARNLVIVVPVSMFPRGGSWRVMLGPGAEFTPNRDELVFRLGSGYEFHLNERWTIAPELFIDWVGSGATTWVGGVAIGNRF